MSILSIRSDESMENIWSILVWEESRLLKDKNAADLAVAAGAMLERWEQVSAGQRAAWRAEVLAQAGVDAGRDTLADTVAEVDTVLQRATRGAGSAARYERYFKQPPHKIVRMGLSSQLSEVRDWSGSLKTEPEPEVQAVGARLEADVAAGNAAVAGRDQAAAARADYRVRALHGFIDELNAARRTRYGLLIQRAEELRLPRGWAARFFKKGPSSAKRKSKQGKAAPAEAKAAPPAAPAQPAPQPA